MHDPRLPVDHVDFDAVAVLKEGSLRLAFEGFKAQRADPHFEEFITANRAWLDDYVLYQSLKDVHAGLPWYEWEPELIERDPRRSLNGANGSAGESAITNSCSMYSRFSGRASRRLSGQRSDADRRSADLRRSR